MLKFSGFADLTSCQGKGGEAQSESERPPSEEATKTTHALQGTVFC
jgi:hypothetical protein